MPDVYVSVPVMIVVGTVAVGQYAMLPLLIQALLTTGYRNDLMLTWDGYRSMQAGRDRRAGRSAWLRG